MLTDQLRRPDEFTSPAWPMATVTAAAAISDYAYDASARLMGITSTYGGNSGPQVLLGYDADSEPGLRSRAPLDQLFERHRLQHAGLRHRPTA